MAISSINIQISTSHAFAHNDRTSKVTYTITGSEQNEYDRTAVEAQAYYTQLRQEATENYKNRTGQKLQTAEEKLRWTAVVNLNAGHTLEHVKNLTAELEKKYGWQPLQIAIHKDEGHITADGKKERNLHAHLEFFMLDKSGLYRFKKKDFRLKDMEMLQTFVAQQLGMDRGVSKKESGRERLEHREYKAVKQAEQATQQQAQTQIEQAKKQLERSTQETAELKQEFEAFRKQLIEQGGHSKEDYKQLGELKKEVVADKKIGTAEALKMLEQLKVKLKEIQEPKLADKLIASATTKTLTGQKVNTNLLKENFNSVIQGVQEIAYAQENVLNRMMRGLNNLFVKAKRVIQKQKETISNLRDIIKKQEQKITELEQNLVENKEKVTNEMIIKHIEDRFLDTDIKKINHNTDKKTENETELKADKDKEQEQDLVRRR